MPYENKFQKYLNDNDSSPSIVEKVNRGIVTTLGAAALIGGGYYGFKKLDSAGVFKAAKDYINSDQVAGAISKARNAYDYFEAYQTGYSETLKSTSWKRVFTGKADDELRNNFKDAIVGAKMGQIRPISGYETELEKQLYELSRTRSAHGKATVENIRLENALAELRGSNISGDTYDVLAKVISKERRNKKLWSGKADDVLEILNAHKVKSSVDPMVWGGLSNTVTDVLRSHKINKDYIKKYNDPIKARLEQIDQQYKASIEQVLKKKRTRSDVVHNVFGFERLTVEKALDLGALNTPINTKYVSALGKNGFKNYAINPQKILRGLRKDDAFWNQIKDAYVDPMVFLNKSGNVVDLRFPGRAIGKSLTFLAENVQVPYVNLRPFKYIGDAFGILNKAKYRVGERFFANSVMPTIENSLDPLTKDYFYFNGRYVDETGKLIKDNQFLSYAKFGVHQRTVTAMSGATLNPRANDIPTTAAGKVRKYLGLGYQDFESSIGRKASAVTKFWNKKWARNIFDTMTDPNSMASVQDDNLQEAFKLFYSTVDNNTAKLDRDTMELVMPYMDGILSKNTVDNMLKGSHKEGTMQAIYELLQSDKSKFAVSGESALAYRANLEKIFNDYMRDPDSFNEPFRTVRKGQKILTPDIIDAVNPGTTEVLTKFDEAEKILHAELLHQSKYTVGDMVEDMVKQGASEEQIRSIKDLHVLSKMQSFGGSFYFPGQDLNKTQREYFSGFLTRQDAGLETELRDQLKDIVYRANPMLGYGPGQQYESVFKGNEYIVLNKTSFDNVKDSLKNLNDVFKSGGSMTDAMGQVYKGFRKDVVNQLGWGKNRYGRGNMDQVSGLSIMSYYYGFRLNEGISKLGLGLSYKDMGSTQDFWQNFGLKRIAIPLAALSAFSYINDEMGNVTGEKPTQVASRTYANLTIGVQTIKEVTGLNALGEHLGRILPGADRLWENPLGLAAKYGTFGLLGETRSGDEMREYYTSGMDPVRKGRFWSIGSSTPVYGDRIMYFQPNWYRRQEADYKMTDSLYGSTGEYWANHWLPNPRNPLGLLNPLTWGHWERKHYEDRPYPVYNTGLDEIPIVGPLLDSTVGRIAMPFRKRPGLEKAHREYLKEINELYTYYAESAKGEYVYMTSGGRVTPSNMDIDYASLLPGGVPGGAPVGTVDGQIAVVDPSSGFSRVQTGRGMARQSITAANRATVSKYYIRPATGYTVQSLRDSAVVDSLDEAVNPNGLGYRLGQTYYSLTEIGGIYGFAATSMFGDFTPRVALQSSIRMKGYERAWWDMEMGGLGGELSEIYRRFLPHRRRNIEEYNPFRNTMPDWMPGQEYLTDFKHGDPYVKVQKGEMRLPGAGYESLNKLHPDFYGEYGALDRFKILADVAPWSEQYRYYSSVVTRMHNTGMISDEDFEQVGKVKDMVTQVKEKYDLHPYKFKYADIDKTEVTVLRVLDDNTFIAKEYPGNPIRLAGIHMPVKSDTSDEAQRARAELAKHIKPGSRIKIGLDADAINRVKDDTMDTMDAIIYDAWGDPLNAKLSRKYSKTVKSDWDETSATSVRALYHGPEITLGKVWEAFAHMDTPLHTKFLQIRSPLEMYKRKELYGKSWQSWSHPVRDLLQPTWESYWNQNPLVAAGWGGFFGFMSGFFSPSKTRFAKIGAIIGGLGASVRTIGDMTRREVLQDNNYAWIPKRRRQEREIDEYFDMLKYVKYRGLYERTRKLAVRYEGFDPNEIVNESNTRVGSTGFIRRRLEKTKKWLKINKSHPFADENEVQSKLDAVNAALDDVASNKEMMGAGAYTLRALQYRQEYMSTLYGADPNGDMQDIYRALPKKDRPFFKEFMLASPKEREEILKLVPKNQRRFYQAKWGLKVDDKPGLAQYFATHNLPDATWEGWNPDVSMDEVKLKFVNQKGLEVGEFGYWQDDVREAQDAPRIRSINGGNAFDVIELKKALEGAGLSDVDIILDVETLGDPPANPFNIVANLYQDRKKDVNKAINDNMAFFLV